MADQDDTSRWRFYPGYEGHYEVSDHGQVRSVDREVKTKSGAVRVSKGKLLSPGALSSGHLVVALCRNGKQKTVTVHRMVLEAFVGPCPEGMECCHFNDVPSDNRLANLRWDTPAKNQYDCVRNGHNANSNKDVCMHGHELTESNVRIALRENGRVSRQCRQCSRRRARTSYLRRIGNVG